MDLSFAKEIAALHRMTVRELREKYAEVFGELLDRDDETLAGLVERGVI